VIFPFDGAGSTFAETFPALIPVILFPEYVENENGNENRSD